MRLLARRAPVLVAVTALAGAGAAAAAVALAASTPKPVAAPDAKGDVRSPLDLTRVSFARGRDGRLRASLTLAAAWTAADLVAQSGPPGSLCLKLWTVSTPPDTPPDFLVCVTADAKGQNLRGSVLRERPNQLPAHEADAAVSRPSDRTVTLRFSQTAIRRPADVRVAGESTRAGCPRVTCIDTAPDAPATLKLQLRAPTTATG